MIINTKNYKVYIGSAEIITKRFKGHIGNLNKGKHHSWKLQRDWDIYGADNFKFIKLQECDNLLYEEQKWLDFCESYDELNYNVSKDASAPMRGRKHSKETIEKFKEKWENRTEKEKNRIKKNLEIGYLLPRTKEHNDKISKGLQGRVVISDEHRKILSKTHKGKKMSKESIDKMIESRKKSVKFQNMMKERNEKRVGQKLSEEHKKAIQDGRKRNKT